MLRLVISGESAGEWPVPLSAALVQEWRDRDGQVCAFGYAEGRRGWLEWPGLATFGFIEGSSDVVATPHKPGRTLAIEDIFRRNASPLILQAFGWEALHASAVVTDQGVVGLCGFSESGKSTLAYALSRLGYRHCADDALLIDLRGAVRVHLLPFTPRLRPPARAFFGVPDPLEGTLLRAPAGSASNPAERLGALFVLLRNDTPTPRVTRLASADAFTNILTHAYCFNPIDETAKRRIVANYLSLVSQVPVFRLEFSGGLHHLDHMAQAVLDTVNHSVLVRAVR